MTLANPLRVIGLKPGLDSISALFLLWVPAEPQGRAWPFGGKLPIGASDHGQRPPDGGWCGLRLLQRLFIETDMIASDAERIDSQFPHVSDEPGKVSGVGSA